MRLMTIACAAVVALASALPASAQPIWYGSLRGGPAWVADADNVGSGVTTATEFDMGMSVAGAGGASFDNNLRVEGEIGYAWADVDTLRVTRDGGVGSAVGIGSLNNMTLAADGDVSAFTFMANGYYDFDTSMLRPYVGGGIGYAHINSDVSVLGANIVDDDDGVFAYQLMVGLSYLATPNMILSGQYRYFGTADPTLTDAAGNSFDTEVDVHNLEVGIRYQF